MPDPSALGRRRWPGDGGRATVAGRRWPGLLYEKLPLFAIACGSAVITLLAQSGASLVAPASAISPLWRTANALKSAGWYLWKTVWPSDLAFYYPHLGRHLPPWQPILSAVILALLSLGVVRLRRRDPALAFGWLWYLGTLVPMSGLVQVGTQAMADRYTYLPHIGIFVAIAWGATSLSRRWPRTSPLLAVMAAGAILALAVVARIQVGFWKDDLTLYSRTLSVTTDNWLIENHIGQVLGRQGKHGEAEDHFLRSIRIRPFFAASNFNLAVSYLNQNRPREAEAQYRSIISRTPENPEAHLNLGLALERQGKTSEAIASYRQALRYQPQLADASYRLATALEDRGGFAEAEGILKEALRLSPGSDKVLEQLGILYLRQGRIKEAAETSRAALDANPRNVSAWNNLGFSLFASGLRQEAAAAYNEALRLNPGYRKAMINFADLLLEQGRTDEAISWYGKAAQINPESDDIRRRLERAQARARGAGDIP